MKKKLLTIVLSVFVAFFISSLMTKETVYADDNVWATGTYTHVDTANGNTPVACDNIEWTLYEPNYSNNNVAVLIFEGKGSSPARIMDSTDSIKSVFDGYFKESGRRENNPFYSVKDKNEANPNYAWAVAQDMMKFSYDIRFVNIEHVGAGLFNGLLREIKSVSFDDKLKTIGANIGFDGHKINKLSFDGLLDLEAQKKCNKLFSKLYNRLVMGW